MDISPWREWPDAPHLDKAGTGSGPAALGFDDTSWRPVQVPHDWAVEPPFDPATDRNHGLKELGTKYPGTNGTFRAQVQADLQTDEIFVNGERQVLVRYPNFDPQSRYFGGCAADAISPERVARWSDPTVGYFHAMHSALWGDFTWRIAGKDEKGGLNLGGGWQNNRGATAHKKIRFVENIFEELDAPGEWFLNPNTHTLISIPPQASISAPPSSRPRAFAHSSSSAATKQIQ